MLTDEQVATIREALDKAIQLATVASDWNLEEVEIDGEMINIYDVRNEFREALTILNAMSVAPMADWLTQFPPEWDRHPWANWAYLQPSSGMDGIEFKWYYFEDRPEWGTLSWNWASGMHGYANPVTRAPLSTFFSVKDTLQQRPQSAT